MNKRAFLAILLACALPLSAMTSCGKKTDRDEIKIPILETKEISYKTVTAEIRDISQKYYQEADYAYPYTRTVRFSASGQIKSIEVEAPCDVKEGQLLCTLYDDDVRERIEEEEIRLEQNKTTVNTLRSNGGSSREIEMAELDLALEQMKYDRLVASLENYKVYAPCDGEFNMNSWGRDSFNVNSPVNNGGTFGYCVDKTQEYLCVMIYDNPLSNVNFGTSVTLYQGAVTSTGTVTDIVYSDNGDFSAYNYVISPDDQDELFDFGEVSVSFDVYSRLDTVVIPKKAVKELSGRSFVYLLVDGVKVEQDIELGIEDNDMVEVTSGLSGGEELIIN